MCLISSLLLLSVVSVLVTAQLVKEASVRGGGQWPEEAVVARVLEEQSPGTPVPSNLESRTFRTLEGRALSYSQLRQSGAHFRLLEAERVARWLAVDEQSGRLTLRRTLDREALCSEAQVCCAAEEAAAESCRIDFTLRVVAPGVSSQPLSHAGRLLVLDLDEFAPRFPVASVRLEVPESKPLGSRFELPPASDPDAGPNGIREYQLENGVAVLLNQSLPFALDFSTSRDAPHLQLRLVRPLDRERDPLYKFLVWAMDGNGNRSSLSVQVSVLDANDNVPSLERPAYNVSVSETAALHSEVLRVRASDPDEGANAAISYELTAERCTDGAHYFEIERSTGALLVAHPLDFESARSCLLVVTAIDSGLSSRLSSTANVHVFIEDENDNTPSLRVLNAQLEEGLELPENRASGALVGYAFASDADSGANGAVTCRTASSSFRLEAPQDEEARALSAQSVSQHAAPTQTYRIVAARTFDREQTRIASFSIVCEDAGRPARVSESALSVRVVDENDVRPIFEHTAFSVRVLENGPPGLPLGSVCASDADEGRNTRLSYVLETDTGMLAHELFAVAGPNCSLVTRVPLDRELCAHYAFRVVATDGGSPPLSSSASVFVEVLDQNDCAPQFSAALYNFTILENNEPNALIGQVFATDPDVGENAALSYALEGPTRHLFWIDAMGRVFARSSLNREQRAVHQLAVLASDNPLGGSPLKGTARMQIFIGFARTDVNDAAPRFIDPPETRKTLRVGTSVIRSGGCFADVRVEDPDEAENALVDLSVRLEGSANESLVEGTVYLSGEPPRLCLNANASAEALSRLRLVLEARDRGTPARSSSRVLRLVVGDLVDDYDEESDADASGANSRPLFRRHVLFVVLLVGAAAGVCLCGVATLLVARLRRSTRSDSVELSDLSKLRAATSALARAMPLSESFIEPMPPDVQTGAENALLAHEAFEASHFERTHSLPAAWHNGRVLRPNGLGDVRLDGALDRSGFSLPEDLLSPWPPPPPLDPEPSSPTDTTMDLEVAEPPPNFRDWAPAGEAAAATRGNPNTICQVQLPNAANNSTNSSALPTEGASSYRPITFQPRTVQRLLI